MGPSSRPCSWGSLPLNCDSLCLPLSLSNFGGGGCPVTSTLSSDESNKSFWFLVCSALFVLGKMRQMSSKLLTCWTGNQKSLHIVYFILFFMRMIFDTLNWFLSLQPSPLFPLISWHNDMHFIKSFSILQMQAIFYLLNYITFIICINIWYYRLTIPPVRWWWWWWWFLLLSPCDRRWIWNTVRI